MTDIDRLIGFMAIMQVPFMNDPDTLMYIEEVKNALKELKAQEPRVMTLDEVKVLPYGHVLIETDKNESLRWLDALMFCKNTNFSFDFITLEGRARLLGTEYNREWRCWTSRPTDEQRAVTPWEPPKEGT